MFEDLERDRSGDLPLLELFYRLRAADLPLGVAEYELLPRALLAGFGFDGAESLKRLCRMLWIKTPDEEVVFNHVFNQFLKEQRPRQKPVEETPETETPEPQKDETPPADIGEEIAIDRAETDQAVQKASTEDEKPPTPDLPIERPAKKKERQIDRPIAPDLKKPEPEIPQPSKPALRNAAAIDDEATHFVIAGGGPSSGAARERRYRFKVDYLPITKRQMKQSWRYLRKSVREGPPVEFDVEATVDKAAVEGRLYEPVMRPRRINRAAMILLVDQEGSMAPFHGFSRRLEETAVRGGRLGQTNVYFFSNCPQDTLYCNPQFSESRPLNTVMSELHPTRTAVLIFSDAGAARNRYSYERIDMTRAFLRGLYQSVRYVAWLNPMPVDRWANTSAAAIARSVPMFDVSREGLQNAISVLRGRTIARR